MTLQSPPLSRDRWVVLEPLLDAALEMDPAKRPAFLEHACGGDAVLVREIKALLDACERADGILPLSAAVAYAPLLTEPTTELPALLGGRYHIVREIGRGGMATVYLADDPKHRRQVAVKVLHTDVARIIGRERFLREIEIAASLSHPHILPLHDSGEVHGARGEEPAFLYFVAPFVAGESLGDRLLREPRLPADEVARLGREIAQALDYAHRQGVVHLDVKPGNILLQDGHAVIADFGIARAISSATTDEHEIPSNIPLLGTPSYMSPEQASGSPDVDGRSDIYSLGCVLYEMVTGKRPIAPTLLSDPTSQEPTAPWVPDRAALAEVATRELASIIMRAMAPSRDDRFPTAGDLARALTASVRHQSIRGWRLRSVVAICGVAAAVIATFFAIWSTRSGSALDANLIAVAPFDAEDPSLTLWREGMVDVMSRNLDGAGALRAVPASISVRRWRGRGDAESARALGAATGAGLVLYGGLLSAGDSVRATALLLDARTGVTLAEFDQRGVADRIDRLSDSLTVAVLRQLGRSRRIDMARATSSPTTSLTALKAYLQGEQFYRAALWDSAQVHFERAIDLDSGFALAYHRLAAVRRWRDPREIPDSTTYHLMRQTSEFARGLGPHERLLATVDSLSAEAYFAWRQGLEHSRFFVVEDGLAHQLYGTLTDGLRRYPDDPELSWLLADARNRFDNDVMPGELDDRGILSLYDRAIALDSAFAPAYVAPISLAAYLDGAASARRYIRAYLAFEPSGPRSPAIRLADVMLDPARASSIDVARLVDTLPADALCEAATLLRHVPDSAETLVRIAQAILTRSAGTPPAGHAPTCPVLRAVDGLQFRGHLREAFRMTTSLAHSDRSTVMYDLTRAGMVSAEESRAEFKRVLSFAPRATNTTAYGWWVQDGDTAAIQTYIRVFQNQVDRRATKAEVSTARSKLAVGRAYVALAKRDTASALTQLLATTDTLHECWYEDRIAIVELLMAKQRYREAANRLERRWPGTSACGNGFEDVVWTMNRARAFERVGRRDEAIENYAFVVDAWRHADPELQTYVRESRQALIRLGSRSH